jgi:glutathione synthase
MEALTGPAGLLALRAGHDSGFLRETLGAAAQVDEFLAWLLDLMREVPSGSVQPLELLLSRNDFFLQAGPPGGAPELRQVEYNSIAASYPGLSGLVRTLHAALWPERRARLAANNPLPGMCDGIAAAVQRYGRPGACVVMVVQPAETNVFDQRLIEIELAGRAIPLRRMSLEQIAAAGALREGHLMFGASVCAVAYLRAGYAPADLASTEARAGRRLLEHSDAIVVPRIGLHLAGTKKVQQVLAQPGVLRRFVDAPTAARLSATFAGLYAPEQPVATAQGEVPAWRAAIADPERFVLKPQREGGGNNFYCQDIPRILEPSTARERAGYILMERIRPLAHEATLVRDGAATVATCVSEIGRFGVLLAEGERVAVNHDVGYLVRTRDRNLREGGVSAGFGHLSSLALQD